MPAGIMRRRGSRNNSSRRAVGIHPLARPTPISIASVLPNGNELSLTFDQPVTLTGIPQYTLDAGTAAPTGAVRATASSVTLTYAASVDTAARINVPFEDPAIRNGSGGYVTPQSYAF